MKFKEFKLRQGVEHTHDGLAVQAGDVVMLTEDQARAFRDKFVPTGDGDFEEMEEAPKFEGKSDPKARGREKEEKGATEEAPQGQPVSQPPVHVQRPAPEGPVDPHALDPARQGQQSREQRDIIDTGGAPVPAVFAKEKEPAKETEAPAQRQPATAGAHVAAAGATTTKK